MNIPAKTGRSIDAAEGRSNLRFLAALRITREGI
jgi:hypothetical protein